MPIGAAAIVGGASLAGAYMTNQTASANAAAANATSIELANTSYQRRVKDLEAAGLNPMLAYTQGGAAVPTIQTPAVQNYGDSASSAVGAYTAGVNRQLAEAQIKTQETQQQLNQALGLKAISDADLSTASAQEVNARIPTYSMSIAKAMSEIDKIAQDTKLSFQQTMLAKQQISNAILSGKNIEADTGNKLADNQLKALFYELGKTNVPAAHNRMNAADTFWGRNVAPFLPDFLNSSAGAKNLGTVLK